MRSFLADPASALHAESRLFRDLRRGWDNAGWPAQEEYLSAILTEALGAGGSILECGSGLTTIVMGVAAKFHGRRVWSLESHSDSAIRVQRELDGYDIRSVSLVTRPLKEFGDFSWYDTRPDELPIQFTFVVCDGPPSTTPGGRYGLVPILRSHLAPGARILLDDGNRDDEQRIAARWADELGARLVTHPARRPFIEIVVPERAA
jgi:hypothetical protein